MEHTAIPLMNVMNTTNFLGTTLIKISSLLPWRGRQQSFPALAAYIIQPAETTTSSSHKLWLPCPVASQQIINCDFLQIFQQQISRWHLTEINNSANNTCLDLIRYSSKLKNPQDVLDCFLQLPCWYVVFNHWSFHWSLQPLLLQTHACPS